MGLEAAEGALGAALDNNDAGAGAVRGLIAGTVKGAKGLIRPAAAEVRCGPWCQ